MIRMLRSVGILFSFFMMMVLPAKAQIITTIAGVSAYGYSGDGGPATSAQLYDPYGVALDGAGNVYIADDYNSCIRKVNAATGVITTIAGTGSTNFSGDGGLAINADLYYPSSVAVDGIGNVYIADNANSRIRKVDATTGIITTIAGMGSSSAFSGDGGPATSAQFNVPVVIALDGAGNIYVSDKGNRRIRKITQATGIITTIAGTGVAGAGGDGGPATSAQLNVPIGVAVDGAGNVYVADQGNKNIRKITAATGIITTIAGTGVFGFSGDGGPASSAILNFPSHVAVDGAGNVYIADVNNQRIRKITSSTGIITTIAGTGTAGFSGDGGAPGNAQLNSPAAMALDGAGNLYVADVTNNRIRKITPGPTSIAGVDAGWAGTLSLSPSPCAGQFTIMAAPGAGHRAERVQISLINSRGKSVYSSEVIPIGAQWSIPVQTRADVANGVYQVCISAGHTSVVRSVIIER